MHQSYLSSLFGRKSLAEELAEVFDSVAELRKLGLNEENPDDEYSYLRIVDLCDAFRGELLQRGIMFVPKDLEYNCESITEEGRTFERVTVLTEFSLIRKREILLLGASYGRAKDRSDKALAIAQTAAFKAQLKRMAMIYGKEDDAEASREKLTPKESVRIASYQKRAWDAGVRDSGLTPEKIGAELTQLMGFSIDANQIPDLPRADFDNCMKWLLAHQDLSGIWAKAVEAAKRGKPQPVVPVIDQARDEIAGD